MSCLMWKEMKKQGLWSVIKRNSGRSLRKSYSGQIVQWFTRSITEHKVAESNCKTLSFGGTGHYADKAGFALRPGTQPQQRPGFTVRRILNA